MKEYTIQLIVKEGSDEFWELPPENDEVLDNIENTLKSNGWDVANINFLSITETF